MKSNWKGLLILGIAGVVTACDNPAVDPNATFEAEGTVQDSNGQPLAGAEVRLIKYSDDLNIFEPSTENLFAESPQRDSDIGLDVSIVQKAQTDMAGKFKFTFTGEEISAPGGYTTAQGLVEVANAVIVVRDPDMANSEKRAGVYTYKKVFMQADKVWGAGTLKFWKADATADTSLAGTAGLVRFSWNKLPNIMASEVSRAYRVDIGAPGSAARLIIRCSDSPMTNETDAAVMGGCATEVANSGRLTRSVSAYSLLSFYSDANGMFGAYVKASGADFRYVARFNVTAPIPDIRMTRDPVGIAGVWAVGAGSNDQDLLNTAATDGNPSTRVAITNNAVSLYVKLPAGSITDAGLLNTLISNAATSCLTIEFTVTDFTDLAGAKGSGNSDWQTKGKFCGETGGKGEVSAIAGFDTTSVNGVLAAWMRIRIDGGGSLKEVGEVAVYKKR